MYGSKLHMLVGDSHVVSRVSGRLDSRLGDGWVRTVVIHPFLIETIPISTEVSEHQMWPAYQLGGFKWFSSATDSNVSVTLARTGASKAIRVRVRFPFSPFPFVCRSCHNLGNLLHLQLAMASTLRLKNKIGTHMVPTAELALKSTTAYLRGIPAHRNLGAKCGHRWKPSKLPFK